MSAEIEKEQKAIAEDLRVRGPVAPVSRVSKKALIIVGGVISAGLGGAVIWSTMERDVRTPSEPPPVSAAGPPESVSTIPRDYLHRGETPVLGPPLPGDLGRPILKAAGKDAASAPGLEAGSGPATVSPMGERPSPAQALGVERLASARSSAIFLAGPARAGVAKSVSAPVGPAEDPRLTSPERLQAPVSPYILQAGTVLPAALITGLRSDVQGVALAQITQDVHDSLGGGALLIPAGARLVGEYAAVSGVGQQRLAVVWTRLILPSGRSIVLDKLVAADLQGMAGLQDGVDRHWRDVWSAAALSTILSVGAEAGASNESDLAQAMRRGTSQALSDVGQQVVGRSVNRIPTLTVRPGAPIRVVLSRDLVLEPYTQGAIR